MSMTMFVAYGMPLKSSAPSAPVLPVFTCARTRSTARTIEAKRQGRSFMSRRLFPRVAHARQKFSQVPLFSAEEDVRCDSRNLLTPSTWRSVRGLARSGQRDAKLMRVNQPSERFAAMLARCCFGEKIFIASEQHPVKFTRTIEQLGIFHSYRSIGLSSEHIDVASEEGTRDGRGHMDIHVERDADSLPAARRRRRTGESADLAARSSAWRRLSSICRSNSA